MYQHKEGVTLRKIERSDLADLLRLKQESWWGTHRASVVNLDDQEHWFENIPRNQMCLVGEQDGPLGLAIFSNIDWVSQTLQISGAVYKHRRKLSKEAFCAGLDFAFEMLNMRRVEAEVLEYHKAAQRLEIDVLGFKVEGRKRQAAYKCGRYYDSLMIGLLREEWQADPRVVGYGDTCNSNFSHDRFEKIMKRFSPIGDKNATE